MKRIYLLIFFLSSILCANSQAIYSEGFEGAFPPSGWTILKTGNGNNWRSNTDNSLLLGPYNAHAGVGAMVYEYSSSSAANAWAITPSVSLSAGQSYSISFFYRVSNSNFPEKMKVTVGTGATIADQSTILWNNGGSTQLTNISWNLGVGQFTPSSSGTYYFGFNCYSAADQFTLSVDDVIVEITPAAAPGCTTNATPADTATNVAFNPLTLTWHPVDSASSYDVYIAVTNPPASVLTTVLDTTAVLTGGAYNTTYYWYIVPRNAAGAATGCVSSVTSFTTSPPPPPPSCVKLNSPLDGATNVNAPSVTLSWSSDPGATAYTVFLGTTNPPDTIRVVSDTTLDVGLDFATTYYWSVVPSNGGGSATGCPIYSFTTMDAPPPPVNDECLSAIAVTPYASLSGSTLSATQTMAADTCAGFAGDANDDVWFKFTALQSGDASIELTPDLNFDGVIVAYSGKCGTFTTIGCADAGLEGDPETLQLTGLTAGTTYYFRVYGYGPQFTEGTFTLRASGTALPVNLVNFKGERNGSRNILSWTTETEQNSKGFELQRSADGKNFSTLQFIKSAAINGNSSSTLKYQFSDEKPFAGNSYYRLKQVDIDGRLTLSDIVLLKGSKANTLVMSNVYPSPARTELKVILGAPSSDKVNLVVTDMAGKIVMQQSAQLLTGDNNISLNVAKLPSGSYMIKAVCASGCETSVSKFVKQ